MDWAFIYLMFGLKIPIAALLFIVWWAIRSVPETPDVEADGNGGTKVRPRHPRRPFPRRPRRGPHGDPLPLPPPRTRTVVARAKRAERA
ncbi:MAG TPA: hypothetical protein VHF51_07925 [Solirubrobacteraceae bacterium]|jgi:hypothetical protein|nr:hypothetical protein [Solirubrobacteraceae bacterium]